ncbi:hypothetical protein [Nocardia salmonicida]|uniref:hypothetical protein n=1 Tax=Nocardia salmonicida TaxID=53431 RepID=UPI002E27CD4F|nr:hypothetical protein [Nocardia salmonicida]
MIPATLAAIAGVLGIVIGRFWDSHAESTRWRRDQKTASYQRYAEEFQSSYGLIRAIALADRASETFTETLARAKADGFQASDAAFITVWMHGSASVVEAATRVEHAMTDLYERAQEHTVSVDGWRQMADPTRRAFEGFLHTMRNELALPAVTSAFFRDRSQPAGASPPE